MTEVGRIKNECPHGYTPGVDFCYACHPKGKPIPQTVEVLQEVMAKDAVLMESQGAEIARLKAKVNQLRQQRDAARRRVAELENRP